MKINYKWTDGEAADFLKFYKITEDYYSKIVGGVENRKAFFPYNVSSNIQDVLIAYLNHLPVGCSGLKMYSKEEVEIKRVWVEPEYRRWHIATTMMELLEVRARQTGYRRMILQTREIMTDAVRLYDSLGYDRIKNYPPYDKLEGAVCFAKDI